MSSKITLKLVRSFSIGAQIFSPKMNGLYFELNFACFTLSVWSRGRNWFGVESYWNW